MEQRPVFFAVSSSVYKKEFLSLMKLDDLLLYSLEPDIRITGLTHIWGMVVSVIYCCISMRIWGRVTGRFLLHEVVLNVFKSQLHN